MVLSSWPQGLGLETLDSSSLVLSPWPQGLGLETLDSRSQTRDHGDKVSVLISRPGCHDLGLLLKFA